MAIVFDIAVYKALAASGDHTFGTIEKERVRAAGVASMNEIALRTGSWDLQEDQTLYFRGNGEQSLPLLMANISEIKSVLVAGDVGYTIPLTSVELETRGLYQYLHRIENTAEDSDGLDPLDIWELPYSSGVFYARKSKNITVVADRGWADNTALNLARPDWLTKWAAIVKELTEGSIADGFGNITHQSDFLSVVGDFFPYKKGPMTRVPTES